MSAASLQAPVYAGIDDEHKLALWRMLCNAWLDGARAAGANMANPLLRVQLDDQAEGYATDAVRAAPELPAAAAERDRLQALVNTPELLDVRDAIVREAAHQRERWGSDHDSGKTAADWHWLIAHLAGRALEHAVQLDRLGRLSNQDGDIQDVIANHREKAVHHVVTAGAAIANWHAHMLGLTNMRPGIEQPKEMP